MEKRKSNYNSYKHNFKKRRHHVLETGLKGFLCTCNGKEKECIRESYNILNDYADRLIGPEEGKVAVNEKECNEDIEDEIHKEVNSLKPKSSSNQRRFQAVDTGANGCVFIKTMLDDPVQLAHSILSDVAETQQQKGRYLLRFVPIEVTCKAYIEDIRKSADLLFDKHFKCDPTTFCIIFNKRNNNSVLRDEVIESLARIVTDKNVSHKADLKQPNLAVIVEIIKGICCMSVLSDYMNFKKYNIFELSNMRKNQLNSKGDSEIKEGKEGEGEEKEENNKVNLETEEKEKNEESQCIKTNADEDTTENKEKETKDYTEDKEATEETKITDDTPG